MLLQFNFSNHKSFREETSLDLTAVGLSEYKDHVFEVGQEKVLPVTAIYGPNASGKSNVMHAFKYMNYYVLMSFGFDLENQKNRELGFLAPPSFAFDQKSKFKESSYEVYFIDSELLNGKDDVRTYNYGFTVNQNGVVEEWLNTKSRTGQKYKKVFYRNEEEGVFELDGISKTQRENIQVALRQEVLVVSLGAKLNINDLKRIYDWFKDNEIIDFGSPIGSLIRESKLPKGFVEDRKVRKNVVDYLSTFDDGIVDFEVQSRVEDADGNMRYSVDAVHRAVDSEDLFSIPLNQESSGTLKMFSLYQSIKNVLEKGSLLFIDELNSKLHPIMVTNLVQTFTNKALNPNGAQLIFTTHDAIQLDSGMLRRDEIWFVEKVKGQSMLYSLADFVDEDGKKIRKDENYLKNYLVGKYGAIPDLKRMSLLSEEVNG